MEYVLLQRANLVEARRVIPEAGRLSERLAPLLCGELVR